MARGVCPRPARGQSSPRRSRARRVRQSPGEEEMKMHPGMFAWWHARSRARHCGGGDEGSCGPHGHGFPPWARHAGPPGGGGGGEDFGGGGFGVRRPLRFLAYKLDLNEAQVTELAAILSEL